MLISQKLGHKAQNMVALLQSNWKLARIDTNTKNGLLNSLQTFVIILKKNTEHNILILDIIQKC